MEVGALVKQVLLRAMALFNPASERGAGTKLKVVADATIPSVKWFSVRKGLIFSTIIIYIQCHVHWKGDKKLYVYIYIVHSCWPSPSNHTFSYLWGRCGTGR